MAMTVGNAYQLVDGLLDKGLGFVAAYLEKSTKRSIIIVDQRGLIHYPNLPANSARVDNIYIQLPICIDNQNFYYRETDRCLFYPIECNGSFSYIIIKNLSPPMLSSALASLMEAKLAIKCYFSNLSKVNNDKEKLAQKLGAYLFFPNHQNITDILERSELNWDMQASFYVSIMEFDEMSAAIDWQRVALSHREYLKNSHREGITLIGQNCLATLIPACQASDNPELSGDLPGLIAFKETIEATSKLAFSQGIGQPHPFVDIKKSFTEARFALTLARLMGARSFTQSFADLGLAALVLAADIDHLKRYCLSSLGTVLDYDRSNHSDLITNLRQLLDNNFNWKLTADNLFIHINTLYYRMNKIEQLLGINLSRMDTRANLYIAVKVWDTLQLNGYWDEYS